MTENGEAEKTEEKALKPEVYQGKYTELELRTRGIGKFIGTQ